MEDWLLVNDIKETHVGVGADKCYELPDGTKMTVADSDLRGTAERLFRMGLQPQPGWDVLRLLCMARSDPGSPFYRMPKDVLQLVLHSLLDRGCHHLVADAIGACPAELQQQLWGNVLLAGGSTLFPGFEGRLHSELRMLSSAHPVRVVAPPERKVLMMVLL